MEPISRPSSAQQGISLFLPVCKKSAIPQASQPKIVFNISSSALCGQPGVQSYAHILCLIILSI
jgi:hypothetical protein